MRSVCVCGIGLFVLLAFVAGCTTTSEKIEDAVDRLGWLEKDSPEWTKQVDYLVDKDRTAARIITLYIPAAYYKGQYYREFNEEIYAIRTGIARALGRMKYAAAATALDDFLPVTTGPASMREECAWAVGEMGEKDAAVITALTTALNDTLETSERVRLAVSVALCKLDDDAGGAHLVRYLASDDPALVGMAEEGLKEAGYHAVPPLVKGLEVDSAQTAAGATSVLAALCDQLIGELGDGKKEVRREAARALGDIGNKKAMEPLLSELSNDSDGRVRTLAATSLSKMGNKRGMDYLFGALASADNVERTAAIEALVESGEAVYERLTSSLRSSDNLLVRAGSARVLGENRVEQAAEALVGALEDDAPAVRWNAAIALGRAGVQDARPHIEHLLARERDPDVIHWAKWALAKLERQQG